MSQERDSHSRQSNYEHIPTGRIPTRRIRTGRVPPGRIPTERIPTIGPQPKRRLWPFIVLMILELLFLVCMVALWLWPYLAMNNYVGPNVEVAQVQISTTKFPHLMHAQVILFDKDHQLSQPIDCYQMQGNTLTLQFDTITFASWENSLGLHLGYKLTRLLGCHSVEARSASRLKRASLSGSCARASGKTLMATSRPRWVSLARYTSPIPPAPSGARIS